jgi:acetoin utilization protein AcuB
LRLSELPVVDKKQFSGMITEEMLFDDDLQFADVGHYPLVRINAKLDQYTHFYDVLKMAKSEGTHLVAVFDENKKYIGVVSTDSIVDAFAASSAVATPGAILVLKLGMLDYSLSEISRIIEINEAKILSSYLSDCTSDVSKIFVTIKLNTENVSRIVVSLSNHGFFVENAFNALETESNDKERLEIFMKYLKI